MFKTLRTAFFIEHFRWLLLNGEIEKVKFGNLEIQPSKLGKMADGKKLPSYMYYLTAVRRQKFQRVFFVVSIIKSHKQMLKCFLQMIFIDVTH